MYTLFSIKESLLSYYSLNSDTLWAILKLHFFMYCTSLNSNPYHQQSIVGYLTPHLFLNWIHIYIFFFFVPSTEPKFEKITKMYKMGTPPLVYCYPLLIATFEIRSLLCVLGFVGLVKYFMLSRVIMYYLKYILYFKTYDVLFASEHFFYFVCKISLCLCAIVYTLYFNFLHTYILYYYINWISENSYICNLRICYRLVKICKF